MQRHWELDQERISLAMAACGDAKLVVDVGGRKDHKLFPPTTVSVGWEGDEWADLSSDPLPFDDGEVDFVFCRHTLEDMDNPAHLLREIKRVAKAGYIETPSPVVELTRGVDAVGGHLGYSHHRWVCLGDGSHLTMCAKYPLIETLSVPDVSAWLDSVGLPAWNTHCLFGEDPLEFCVLQNEQGFALKSVNGEGVPVEYVHVLLGMARRFVNQSSHLSAAEVH